MSEISKWFDNFSNKIFKLMMWIGYFLLTIPVLLFFKEPSQIFNNETFSTFIIAVSIWIWVTVRWLKRNGYISKGSVSTSKKEISLIPFLLTNILAPVAVSYLTFLLTGETSLSLVSVPITSFLSANIELG